MVGIAGARVGGEAHAYAGGSGGSQDAALDRRPRAWVGRLQEEAAAAVERVERQREREVVAPVQAGDAANERRRSHVVGLPGVGPLLGAGGHQPDVAAGAK